MAEFVWHVELAARPAGSPLLLGSERNWTAGEVVAELRVVRERLNASRVVGVLADNGPAWVIADLACQDADVVHLPLPAFFHGEQLRHALDQAGADTVLTDQPERIGALDLGFAITGRWQGLSWMRRVVERAGLPVDLPAGTAKISFTSGSTGAPKGVCLSADGLIDTARAVRERLADLPLASHLAVLPLALLLENVAGIYAPLLRGMAVHVPRLAELGWAGMQGFDAAALDHTLRESGAASVILVPELLKAWTTFMLETGDRAPDSLQFAAVGGARVASELLAAARRAGIPAYQGYGLTEGGSVLALNRPGDDGDGVGRPLAHAQLLVEADEVLVRTRAFLGYIGQPLPLGTAFPTGDLATLDAAGHLHLAGRRTNLLITSFGRNISPEWVEAVLLAQPQILQAIVVGDGLPALLAIVVPSSGVDAATLEAAVARANASLPDYARIAHHLVSSPFTPVNGLGTGNGRPRRSAIIEHHRAALLALHPTRSLPMSFYEKLKNETAVARAHLLSAPVISECLQGRASHESYLAFLAQAYHHVRHTTPLLMTLGGRLPERLAWMRPAVAEYIDEEIGHEEWILNDITAAGGDAQSVRASLPALPAEVMIAFAYDLINRGNPAAFFGMVFVLEGTSVDLALNAADRIQQALGLPNKAFSYLRSHGTLDQAHTQHLADILDRMTPADQADVLHAARVFYKLYGDIFHALPIALPADRPTVPAAEVAACN